MVARAEAGERRQPAACRAGTCAVARAIVKEKPDLTDQEVAWEFLVLFSPPRFRNVVARGRPVASDRSCCDDG